MYDIYIYIYNYIHTHGNVNVYVCVYIYIYTIIIICTIVSTIEPPLLGISENLSCEGFFETHPIPPKEMNQAFGFWVGDGGGIQYLALSENVGLIFPMK